MKPLNKCHKQLQVRYRGSFDRVALHDGGSKLSKNNYPCTVHVVKQSANISMIGEYLIHSSTASTVNGFEVINLYHKVSEHCIVFYYSMVLILLLSLVDFQF